MHDAKDGVTGSVEIRRFFAVPEDALQVFGAVAVLLFEVGHLFRLL
jgi:hypothetical protein